jgi:hypothetical protein
MASITESAMPACFIWESEASCGVKLMPSFWRRETICPAGTCMVKNMSRISRSPSGPPSGTLAGGSASLTK